MLITRLAQMHEMEKTTDHAGRERWRAILWKVPPFGNSTSQGAGVEFVPPPNCVYTPKTNHAVKNRLPYFVHETHQEEPLCFNGNTARPPAPPSL